MGIVRVLAVVMLLASTHASADVRCKKFPSTEPGPIMIFTGNQCPLGWQPA